MAEEEGKLGSGKHITTAQGEPGGHNKGRSQGHIYAAKEELFDASDASASRIGVKAPLQYSVVERIGDDVDLSTGEQIDEFEGICVVIGVHGGTVAGRDATLPALLDGIGGHYLG